MAYRLLVGLFSLLLIAAAVAWVFSSRSVVGDVELVEDALSPSITVSTTTSPGPAPAHPDEEPDANVIPPNDFTLLQDVATQPGPAPIRLRIDSIGVAAPIVPTGVDSGTGLMEVPANVSEVAWYRHGPVPGSSGSAVLAAHVDLANQGPGVFFRLEDVAPGDRVSVQFADGSEQWFRVEGRVVYLKEELPLETVFSREGSPVLTIITCGGGFSESDRSYDSNVVVYAVPVAG